MKINILAKFNCILDPRDQADEDTDMCVQQKDILQLKRAKVGEITGFLRGNCRLRGHIKQATEAPAIFRQENILR